MPTRTAKNVSQERVLFAGFTLIELLVVIGIVVILSVVVILTLNPAELLRQARDSTRFSDLSTLKSGIALYLADAPAPLSLGTQGTVCYVASSSNVSSISTPGCGGRFTGGTINWSSSLAVNGIGWVPINFTAVNSGAPLSALPVDPVNNATNFYGYRVATSALMTYELNADLESSKYTIGNQNYETTDGGNSSTVYEVGTASGLGL